MRISCTVALAHSIDPHIYNKDAQHRDDDDDGGISITVLLILLIVIITCGSSDIYIDWEIDQVEKINQTDINTLSLRRHEFQ
jgi:hypothetical protein